MSEAPVKLLLIEDTPKDAELMREALAEVKDRRFEVVWADRLSTALEHLTRGGIDLILTDLDLPDSKGLETVAGVHAHASGIPIVVLTSSDDDGLALRALQQGAQDYLVKGYVQVYRNLLGRSIRYAIERKAAEEKEKELVEAIAITEGKRAAELEKAYQELKQTQSLLVQAEKMAAVGQLASGIAHEVKNPLNIILQCINYLEPEIRPQGGQRAEVLQAMREAVMTADRIIRGLLDFSKPTLLELKPTAIGAVIDASLVLVKNQLAKTQVRLMADVPATLPAVMLDEHQMKQVFLNVLLNALHAMPTGGTLTIRSYLKRLTERGHGVGLRASDMFRVGETVLMCEVEDTGTGISKENLPKVFNPFFTTKAPGEGVGLGLSITETIVKGHRGVIRIESEEGRGTRVIIALPIPKAGGA